jgi:hypothetical protein
MSISRPTLQLGVHAQSATLERSELDLAYGDGCVQYFVSRVASSFAFVACKRRNATIVDSHLLKI